MNNDIKSIWVNALRSGEYEQGTDYLLKDGKYCCLGVLTDLYIKEHGLGWEEGKLENMMFEDEAAVTPPSVINWSGIPDSDPSIFINGRKKTVAMLNDAGLNFNQMADVIEYFL